MILANRYKPLAVLALVILAGLVLPFAAGADELQDALGNPVDSNGSTALTFVTSSTSGTAPWSPVTTTVHTGMTGSAAKSGAVAANQYTRLETTVTGTASVSFYQKVSSEPTYDGLSFYIDTFTTPKSRITGSVNWQQKNFVVSRGTHTLRWEYKKNGGTVSKGSDAAWVGRVVVSPHTALKVLSPNGGEKLISGTTTTIIWNAPAAAEKYDLLYSLDNGVTWPKIATNVPATVLTGARYAWTLPVPTGNKPLCKVKVVAKNSAGVIVGTDVSDTTFSVNNVRLTAPNGGNVIEAGDTFDITWEATASATGFALSYSWDSGTTWKPITTVGDVTTYSWTVPTPPTGNKTACKVKVVAYNGFTVIGTDLSDTAFTTQVLKVTSPNGGEHLNAKTNPTYPVNFTVYGQSAAGATVSYTTDGGVTWSLITKITGTIAPGDFPPVIWNVPAVTAVKKSCKVKVVLMNKAGAVLATDVSDANFTIEPILTISGVVTKNGVGFEGVTMTLTGDDSGTATTNSSGSYSFKTLLLGNYTLTPFMSGYDFTPVSKNVTLSATSASGINFAVAVPKLSTQVTPTVPPVMSFRQSVPSNDHAGPYDEIFPGQANVWILEPDFTVVDGFDMQWGWSGALALSVESPDYPDSFWADQTYDELKFFTPLMTAADGVKVAAVSDGKTVLSSLPAQVQSVITGTYSAFLNATSKSVMRQTLDLRSVPTGTTLYLQWTDAVSLWSNDLDASYNMGFDPAYSAVLYVDDGRVFKLFGPVPETNYNTGSAGLLQSHSSTVLQNYIGHKVVLSFEIDSSTWQMFKGQGPVLSPSYAIVDQVTVKDYKDTAIPGIVTNGGFETGDLTGWTTNEPAAVQNVTSGARTVNGLIVTRSFYTVPNKLWARWVDVFYNPSLVSAVTRTITYTTELGSGPYAVIYDPENLSVSGSPTPRALTSWDSTAASWSTSGLTDGTRDIGLVFGKADVVNFASDDGTGTWGSPFITVSYQITVPKGGRVAIVNFALMDGTDTGVSSAVNSDISFYTENQATQIDTEAKNILSNFWTDAEYRTGMTAAQIQEIVNFPK